VSSTVTEWFRSSPRVRISVWSTDGIGRRTCVATVAGVADVLAGGPIRGGLQAHLALTRVAEQPSPPVSASLLE